MITVVPALTQKDGYNGQDFWWKRYVFTNIYEIFWNYNTISCIRLKLLPSKTVALSQNMSNYIKCFSRQSQIYLMKCNKHFLPSWAKLNSTTKAINILSPYQNSFILKRDSNVSKHSSKQAFPTEQKNINIRV